MLLSQNAPAVGHWRGILKKPLLLFQSSILRDRGHGRTADPAQVNIKGFISWLVSAVNKHCCVLSVFLMLGQIVKKGEAISWS